MKRLYFVLIILACSHRIFAQAAGDYVATASMEWNSSNWSISNGSGGYSSTGVAAPTSTKNVFILSGATVTVVTTTAVCNNLTVNSGGILNPTAAITASGATEMDGTLTGGTYTATGAVNVLGTWTLGTLTTNNSLAIGATGVLKGTTTAGGSVQTLNINGTSPTVTIAGQLGGPSKGVSGESIRLYCGGSGTTTFTGTGKFCIARFQPVVGAAGTAQTIVIDIDMNIGNNSSGVTGLTLQTSANTTANKTFIINQGKTVTLSNVNGGFHNVNNAITNAGAFTNMTYTVNGTLDISAGTFVFYTFTSTASPNPTASLILNVGSTGVLKLGANVRLGKLANNQTAAINVASGGVVDCSSAALNLTTTPVSANGTSSADAIWFTLNPGSTFKRLVAAGVATPLWIGPTNTNYNPVTVTPTTASVFTAAVATGNTPTGTLNTNLAINRTWTITPVTPSSTTLTFGYNGTAVGGGDANSGCDPTAAMKLWYNNGTSWSLLTPTAVASAAGSETDHTVTFPGITSFPTFALLNDFTASTNASLSALSTSSGTLSPVFASGTNSYTASVSNATTSITVTPTTSDATATVTVNGTAVTSGSASGSIALVVGTNTITTVVTAQDGATTKTYTLTVSRPAIFYSNASSSDLSNLASYGSNPDGSGTPPTDFNGSGVNATYQLANRSSYTLTTALTFGSTLNIPTGATLDLAGNALTLTTLSGTGTLTGSYTSSLTVNGTISSLAFATGKEQLGSLTLGSGASLTMASFLAIGSTGTVTLGANATLNTNNTLSLRSDISGTAQIAALGTGASITGGVTVERYLADKRAWRLISPSVYSTQTINSAWQEGAGGGGLTNPNPGYGTFIIGSSTANGFDIASTSGSLLAYNGTAFNSVPNTNSTLLNTNGAYFLFSIGNRGVNPATAGVHSATTLHSYGSVITGTVPATVNATGYTLLGNPYPAPVDFSQVTRSATVPNQFYTWDINLGTYGGYVLVSYNGSSYTSVPSSPSGLTNIIPEGAAIFVQSDGTNTGTLTLNESSKATGTGSNTFSSFNTIVATTTHDIRVNLINTSNNLIDGVMASFAAGNSNKVDNNDAKKLPNFYENIALARAGSLLTLERRSDITSKDSILIQMSGIKTATYQLQVDPTSFDEPGMTASLEDAYLHTSTKLDLSQVSNISFNTTTDTATYKNRFKITFSPVINTVMIKTPVESARVIAYPNPATGKQINLTFDGMPLGSYSITVSNTFGQVMQKSSMVYNGASTGKTLNADYTTGVYMINIQSASYNQSIKVIVR